MSKLKIEDQFSSFLRIFFCWSFFWFARYLLCFCYLQFYRIFFYIIIGYTSSSFFPPLFFLISNNLERYLFLVFFFFFFFFGGGVFYPVRIIVTMNECQSSRYIVDEFTPFLQYPASWLPPSDIRNSLS